MNTNENKQNMDLFFKNKEKIISNFKDLKNNLEEISDLMQRFNISDLIKANESILLFVKQYFNENQGLTSTDFEANKNFFKNVEKIKNYFNNKNEEISNLYKIVGLIIKSKDILESFNHSFFTTITLYSIEHNPLFCDEKLEKKDKNIINKFPFVLGNSDYNDYNYLKIKAKKSYEQSSLKEKNKNQKFIDNCREAVNLVVSNFNIIKNQKNDENNNFPICSMTKLEYLDWLLNYNYNSKLDFNNNSSFSVYESTGTIEYDSQA